MRFYEDCRGFGWLDGNGGRRSKFWESLEKWGEIPTSCPQAYAGLATGLARWRFGLVSLRRCASMGIVLDLAGSIGTASGCRNLGNHWKKWGEIPTSCPQPYAGLATGLARWRLGLVSLRRCASMGIVVDLAGSIGTAGGCRNFGNHWKKPREINDEWD